MDAETQAAVDGLYADFTERFAKAKYTAGLLLAMCDLVEQAGANTGQYADGAAFLAARQVPNVHQLVIRGDRADLRLRALYERWERFFRLNHGRGRYPSSAAHATNQWDKHRDWLDRLVHLNGAALEQVRSKVKEHVLAALPEEPPSQEHAPLADQVVSLAQRVVQDRMSEPDLELEVARAFPSFDPREHGHPSLRALLFERATEAGAAERVGEDVVWASTILDHDPGLDEAEAAGSAPLHRLTLRRYRAFREATVEFGAFTLVVGPNAAGKSCLLDAVFRVARMTRFPPRTLFRGANAAARVRTQGEARPFELEVEQAGGVDWRWTEDEPVPRLTHAPMGPVARLVLDPRRIAESSVSDQVSARMCPDGSGVSTVLADLASSDPDRFDRVIGAAQHVIPGLERLRVVRVPVGARVGLRMEARFGGHWIPADQLSDGTLLVLALHTAIVAGGIRLLLIDDVDRGLHPQAQRKLLQQLLDLSGAGGIQIVATTHSATVLDGVAPASVRLVQASQASGSRIRSLTDHPRWKDWDVMRPGEFWTFIGEDWQVEA